MGADGVWSVIEEGVGVRVAAEAVLREGCKGWDEGCCVVAGEDAGMAVTRFAVEEGGLHSLRLLRAGAQVVTKMEFGLWKGEVGG